MRYTGMGAELAGGVIGFVLLGYWIDSIFKTSPVWVTTLATVGCFGGLYNLIRRAILLNREMTEYTKRDDEQR